MPCAALFDLQGVHMNAFLLPWKYARMISPQADVSLIAVSSFIFVLENDERSILQSALDEELAAAASLSDEDLLVIVFEASGC